MKIAMSDAFESILPPDERAKRLVGRTVDGYELTELRSGGEGGSGVVYSAHHPDMGDAVIKVLKVDIIKNEYAHKRFKREIKMLVDMGRVEHVVDVRHAGVIDDMPWYAMEKVNGETLGRWLNSHKNPVSVKKIQDILSGILSGLQQIQKENEKLVHRDIKPNNIMIEIDNESGELNVMIIDFGISLDFENQESQENTNTQTLREMTRLYASPEMVMNSITSRKLDSRSDQFQVGLLAYELMTRHRYWDDWPNSKNILMEVKHYPRWLRKIVIRSLTWDRDQRYSNHQEFNRWISHPHRSLFHPLTIKRHAASAKTVLAVLVAAVLLALVLIWNSYSMDFISQPVDSTAIIKEATGH